MTDFNTPTNPPAFPTNQNGYLLGSGMHLRDYFAAQALQGILSDPNFSSPDDKLAEACYLIANAMLKAREA
jgi:hypothetical protein